MTTEFTLRKISKLVSKIDGRVHALQRDVRKNITVSVVIHDSVDSMLAKATDARDDYGVDLETLQSLLDARVVLRGALGSANQTAGINYAVTELRGLEQKLAVVSSLLKTVPDETQLSKDTLARRMNARAMAQGKATIDVGYGGRYRDGDSDSVTLPVLLDQDVEELKAAEKTFKNAIEATHDKLEHLNSSVGIELPDDVIETLTDLEILGL